MAEEGKLETDIFKRPVDDYRIRLNPVTEYIKQAATYISKIKNIPYKEAVIAVQKALKNSNICNPTVTFNSKQPNGDMEITTDSLNNYIKDTLESGEIIVPSFTRYTHPSVKKSIHSDFLAVNVAARKQDKEKAFEYKQLKKPDLEKYYTVMQKVRKIDNNSLSGAYGCGGNSLTNPSAHYTLTSMTRCVASIGNIVSESIVSGNKHFKTPETVFSYITAILTNITHGSVDAVLIKYDLYRPTVNEVYDALFYSFKDYWRNEKEEQLIMSFLCCLDSVELSAVMYVNDLWNIKNYNPEFTRTLLDKISTKHTTGSLDVLKDINSAPEGILNLAHHICMDDIKGLKVDYKAMKDTPEILAIASTCKAITFNLQYYFLFFRTFFTSDVMPPNMAYVREMVRDAIVLSDTDSTCAAYDKWVEWYYGDMMFGQKGAALAGAVMTINTQVIDHNLRLLARNMNIPLDKVDLLKMKNEYYWSVFTPANVNKHYFANTLIQEGNVFDEPALELKGVHFIASAVNQDIVKLGKGMMEEIHTKLTNGEKISMYDFVTRVADLERKLIAGLEAGDVSIFKKERINNKTAYKNDPEKSNYLHHIFWEEVMKDKYGSPGEPMYAVAKIPIGLETKTEIAKFLESIEDEEIRTKWSDFLVKYNKQRIGSFKLPNTIAANTGIPVEIKKWLDINKIVLDNCNMFYIILETIGFYKKPDMLVSEMGY